MDFFEKNKKVFDEVVERRTQLLQEYLELDENGQVKMEQGTKEVTETVKGKYFWNKDKVITKTVPTPPAPIFKEGKTMEGYQKAMQEFMQEKREVSTKPQIFSKFPIVLNV